jgi:Fe-S cluster assembly protein SufD
MTVVDSYRDAFAQLAARSEPKWLEERRAASLEEFAQLGIPTRRDEEWKYTDLSALKSTVYGPGQAAGSLSELASAASLPDVAATLVFRNGRLSTDESTLEALPDGVRVVVGDAANDHLRNVRPLGIRSGLDALRDAFTDQTVAIEVDPGVELELPIHVIRVAELGGAPWMCAQQTVIRLGTSAVATLIETFVGHAGAEHFTNVATDTSLAANAELRHYRLLSEGPAAAHVGTHAVRLERDCRYRSFSLMAGGRVCRETLTVEVNGPGAHSDVASIYAPGTGQCHDSHTLIDHRAPNCTADQLYKGILHGGGHGIFNGKIYVQQIAQQTNANQLNQNLMLSKNARVDTKPQLEIFADDVRCTHGATVGQIEPEELFYMMSRAIPEFAARRMIVAGFAEDVLQRVSHPPTARRMRELLDAHLD